jgi:endoglucanase
MMDRRAFILGGIAAFGAPSAIDAQMVEERRRPIGAMSGNQNAQGAAEREAQPVLALRRGLNLSHWFAQAPRTQGYSQEHLSVHTTASDLALIRRLGFDHARLSVDPALLFTPADVEIVQGDRLQDLERAVQMIIDADLAVVIDMHPSSDFKKALGRDDGDVERFADFWHDIAGRFARRPAERVVFEILNEPEFADRYRWSGVQGKLLASIRQAASRHTVIVSGHRWASIDELLSLEPVRDANVIYNFHFYLPHIFTHQGAVWGMPFWRHLIAVPYPSSVNNVAPLADLLSDDVSRLLVMRYGYERWNGARIRAEIQQIAAWATKRNVRLMCNEFGVYRRVAPASDRARWIGDVRTALEMHGIGWTMWDYAGDFGLVTKQSGQSVVDDVIVSALGLDPRS